LSERLIAVVRKTQFVLPIPADANHVNSNFEALKTALDPFTNDLVVAPRGLAKRIPRGWLDFSVKGRGLFSTLNLVTSSDVWRVQ
jgi:hypothetical protein